MTEMSVDHNTGSLWSVDLMNDFSQDHPLSILRAQSDHLSKLTEGKLSSWVLADSISDGSLHIRFGVVAGPKKAQILTLTCPFAGYPVDTRKNYFGPVSASFDSPAAFMDGIRKHLADKDVIMMLRCLTIRAYLFEDAK